MMIAVLFAAIGAGDLIRSRLPRYQSRIGASLGALVILLSTFILRPTIECLVAAAAAVTVTVAWFALTAVVDPDKRRNSRRTDDEKLGIMPSASGTIGLVILALAIVLSAALSAIGPKPAQFVVSWWASLPYTSLQPVSFTTFALIVGGLVFLLESSNVAVRIVLSPKEYLRIPNDSKIDKKPRFRRRERRAQREPIVQSGPRLKGGRIIGPLERVFLFALALSGQFVVIGALVAAKGIVRFPEISRDDGTGSRAEEFLVGSFTSGILVLAMVALIQLQN